jgi:O-antigen/teichoic acid export membrane protein
MTHHFTPRRYGRNGAILSSTEIISGGNPGMRINNINSLQFFQVLQFGTAVLIGIFLAKSGLPLEQISLYEAWMFIGSLFSFFWVSGGQNALLQQFPKLEGTARPTALFNVFVLFSAAGVAAGGMLFLSRHFVTGQLTNFSEVPNLDLLAIYLVFNCPAFLVHIYYLLIKRYSLIVWFALLGFSLQLAAVVVPIYLGYTLREAMTGLVAVAVFKYSWALVLLYRHTRWRLDRSFVKKYAALAVPLILLALIGKGADYASGLVVTSLFEDEKAFAIFRYGAREFPLAVLMVGALATSLIPETAENLAAGLERIKASTRKLSHWLFPLSMLSMLASPILFPVVFSEGFKESARVFNIFTLLLSSRILLPNVIVMSQGKNYFLTLSATIELVLLTVLSWWWGSLWGLEGVAFAVAAAFFTDRLIVMAYVWKALKISPLQYIDRRTYLGYNVPLYLVFWLSLYI